LKHISSLAAELVCLQRGHANPERRNTHNADYYLFRKTGHLSSKMKEQV
jgi:hypothetical protein